MTKTEWRTAIFDDSSLPRTTRVVGYTVTMFGKKSPTPADLARSCSLPESEILQHLARLERRGWVQVR